jgi:3-oxoacyl-[acyl-carrier protein] reductase
MTCDLSGRTALVTGASAGIGRGVAMVLAESGARVIAVARRGVLLEELVDELPGDPGQHQIVVADLATDEGIDRVIRAATRATSVDIVVNNAGTSVAAPPGTADATWQDAFAVQFRAPRQISESLLDGMRDRRYGRILLIGGTLEPGDIPNASTAAKAALVAWAKGLANAVASAGITINTIVPGRITSEQVLTRLHPDPVERAEFARSRIPARRFGDPHEVGHLVAFLASPQAAYITGTVIPIDGGLRRHAF